jgi:hypothetical protein
LTINTPVLGRIFSDIRKVRLLLLFAGEPRSVSDAAADSGQSVAKAFYHVTNLVKQGLLQVTREEQRHGRPVKYYQTVAPAFFVPIEFMSGSAMGGLAEEMRESLQTELIRDDIKGMSFSLDASGGVLIQPVITGSKRLRSPSYWLVLRLSEKDAASLDEEMRALLAKYQALAGVGTEYIVHAAMAGRRETAP